MSLYACTCLYVYIYIFIVFRFVCVGAKTMKLNKGKLRKFAQSEESGASELEAKEGR